MHDSPLSEVYQRQAKTTAASTSANNFFHTFGAKSAAENCTGSAPLRER